MRTAARTRSRSAGVRPGLVAAVFIGLMVFAFIASTVAYVRSSASYRVSIDEVTLAGGAASGSTYAQPDAAAGQEGSCGYSSSGSYKNYAGVVQPLVTAAPPRVTDWRRY